MYREGITRERERERERERWGKRKGTSGKRGGNGRG